MPHGFKYRKKFIEALKTDNAPLLEKLLTKKNVNPNGYLAYLYCINVLEIIIENNSVECLKTLLNHDDFKPNKPTYTSDGASVPALIMAIKHNRLDITRLLAIDTRTSLDERICRHAGSRHYSAVPVYLENAHEYALRENKPEYTSIIEEAALRRRHGPYSQKEINFLKHRTPYRNGTKRLRKLGV